MFSSLISDSTLSLRRILRRFEQPREVCKAMDFSGRGDQCLRMDAVVAGSSRKVLKRWWRVLMVLLAGQRS